MPLIVCTVVLLLLFSFEGLWYVSDEAMHRAQLDRYQSVEHPRRRTSDAYLDLL